MPPVSLYMFQLHQEMSGPVPQGDAFSGPASDKKNQQNFVLRTDKAFRS